MTLDTLLIPTDGSDPAEDAARRGFALADALDASVHVLSVADSAVATGTGYAGDSASIRQRLQDAASARATSLRDEAAERGLEATAATREGIPAAEIADYADENGIDAIAIGTSGRGGLTRAIVGSVADKVVRTASVPVVTITPDTAETGPDGTEHESILLPTDGSEPASAAIQRGLALAERLEATVHFLTVVDADLADALGTAAGADTDPSSRLREEANAQLEELAADAEERGLDTVTATTEGRPTSEIVDYAAENDVDAIAMGTHGRGGFERLVLGSVTDGVIRRSPVPVFTVRPDGLDAETRADSVEPDGGREPTRIAFVCVQNAGRSQMAAAFARREREARSLESDIDVVTGGTQPADRVHPEVVAAMADVGIDLSDRSPRAVTVEELQSCDYVVTMGCSATDVCPAGWAGDTRDWDLADPDDRSPDEVAAIRDEIERRVTDVVDELEDEIR